VVEGHAIAGHGAHLRDAVAHGPRAEHGDGAVELVWHDAPGDQGRVRGPGWRTPRTPGDSERMNSLRRSTKSAVADCRPRGASAWWRATRLVVSAAGTASG